MPKQELVYTRTPEEAKAEIARALLRDDLKAGEFTTFPEGTSVEEHERITLASMRPVSDLGAPLYRGEIVPHQFKPNRILSGQ